jgi:hypothetical protein
VNVEAAISRLRAQIALADPAPPPPPSTEIVAAATFTFSSGTLVLGAFPPGGLLTYAQLIIQTSFNSLGATVRFGTSVNPQLFLADVDSSPHVVGQYVSESLVPSAPDVLLLSVNPAGATQGAGLLFYRILI